MTGCADGDDDAATPVASDTSAPAGAGTTAPPASVADLEANIDGFIAAMRADPVGTDPTRLSDLDAQVEVLSGQIATLDGAGLASRTVRTLREAEGHPR